MDYKNIIGLAFTYTGAVIGAGFFSGSEIWRFFGRNGGYGFFGIFISGIFFVLLATLFLERLVELSPKNYHMLFYTKSNLFGIFFDFIYSFFLWCSCVVMFTGMLTIVHSYSNFDLAADMLIIFFIIFTILYFKLNGIFNLNIFIIPLLVVIAITTVILFIPDYSIDFLQKVLFKDNSGDSFLKLRGVIDASLYGSYNLALVLGVMVGMINNMQKKEVILSTVIGGFILVILNLLIFIGLKISFYQTPEEEMPMLFLARKNGYISYFSYIIGLFFAMLSTMLANCYTLIKRLEEFKISYSLTLFIVLVTIFPLTKLGFSRLVSLLYPISGFFGLLLLTYLAYLLFLDDELL